MDYPVITVKGTNIAEVGKENESIKGFKECQEIILDNKTLLPGLIDSHLHLALGTRGGYEAMMQESDGIQLITGVINSRNTLYSGVTTILEAGARNRVAFDLKQSYRTGLIETPRLLVSGRPITVPGGHFHFCKNNEARGVKDVKQRVRELVEEGVDFIKIMASGGGTGGTDSTAASFSVKELKAIVEESHMFRRITVAHCEAYDSVGNAARAGVDVLAHCGFILSDGSRGFDKEAVKTMAEKKLFYDPTLQTGSKLRASLINKKETGERLTEKEKKNLQNQEYKVKRKQENLMKMVKYGVQIVAGSDGIGLGNSTRLYNTLELMVGAGMMPMQAIVSATSNAAKAIKMEHTLGTLKRGLKADIIAVDGDPSKDISCLRNVGLIMQNGKIIYSK
jgi:imidazolonepropionase-like amidohydrolase